jgi:dihydroorotase (multifunctional complex type)
VVTPQGVIEADVLVDGEKIAGLVNRSLQIEDVGQEIDATGKAIFPGMVDVHVHTREPGYTHKEDITTTCAQAAAGGVTTIFGMPNLMPPTTSAAALDDVLALYREKAIVDYNHNPAPMSVDEVEKMAERGIAAFKIYMVVDTGRDYPHPSGTGMHDHGELLRVMDSIAPTGLRFIIHPHDQALMNYIEGMFLDSEGNTPQGYAKAFAARDGVIWDTACDLIIRLAEAAGCRVHLAHVQTVRSTDAIRRAKVRGVEVTAEVNHWALFLGTWRDVEELGPFALSYWVPDDAREAIWNGLSEGVIDILSSDHAPHTRDEKEIGWTQMWSAHTGTPGIQFQLPLLIDAAVSGRLSLEDVARVTAMAPAQAFGLSHSKGAIQPGLDADLVLVDLDSPWTITNEDVLSRCGWTPYDGRKCRVRIDETILRGRQVFAHGEVVGRPGMGRMAQPRISD